MTAGFRDEPLFPSESPDIIDLDEVVEEAEAGAGDDAWIAAEEYARPRKEIATETIAGLYIKQGHMDRAIDIYRTLHDARPEDEDIKIKLDELERERGVPAAKGEEPGGGDGSVKDGDVESIKRLESWLEAIRREKQKV